MKVFILVFCMMFLFSSCYHVYYSPNTTNAPLFTEKDELRANASLGTGVSSEITTIDLQFAYAFSKNAAFMLNGFNGFKSETGAIKQSANISYIEFAPGIFKSFDKKNNWAGEFYAGFGTGGVRNEYPQNDFSRFSIRKIFFQPGFGYKSKHFDAILAPKLSFIKLNLKKEQIINPDNSYDKEDVEVLKSNPAFTAFEPALILRSGGEKLKAQLAITLFEGEEFLFEYDMFETSVISLGVSLNLRSKKK